MKEFIVEQLRILMKENVSLTQGQLKNLLHIGMETSFDNDRIAKSFINKNINIINELPSEVTLYRVIFAKNANSIDRVKIGSHYVSSKKELEQTHQQLSHVGGGIPFMVVVKAPKSLIDTFSTLKNRVQYPHENEITLLNYGVGAKVIKVIKVIEFQSTELGYEDVGDEIDNHGHYDDDDYYG